MKAVKLDAKTEVDLQSQLSVWKDDIWRYDYFAVMRRLESCDPIQPRWGTAALPKMELIRVAQDPALSFAPAALSAIENTSTNQPAKLRQRFIGYVGPNGPLPVHMSDFIRERALHHGDMTWLSFLDGFSHRFSLHFYRAWAQAQPAVCLDRPAEDNFRRHVGSFIGLGIPQTQERDKIHDDAKLYFSGWLSRQPRSPDGIEAVLAAYFKVPVRLEQWVGHWMSIADANLTRLGQRSSRLGQGVLMGSRVWDRQHRIRLHIGPLNLEQYESFLPGSEAHQKLVDWMAQLLGHEYHWDAKLTLLKSQVPQAGLKKQARLGWTSWLGAQPRTRHAADVLIYA